MRKYAASEEINRGFLKVALLGCLVAVLAAMPALGGVASPGPLLRVLFLTGESDQPHHDWKSTTPFLRNILEGTGRFEIKVNEVVDGLDAETLRDFDAIILNYNGPRWSPGTEKAIEDFLRGGKGLVALHGVSYGTFFGMVLREGRWTAGPAGSGWAAYPEMIGSTWKPENIGHAVRHVFEARWADRDHPISRGLPERFLVDDELYHRMDLKPGVHVLASAFSDPAKGGTGQEEPLLWTVPFGSGRVVHTTMGHDTASMYQQGFRAAFARSVEWAAAGAVSQSPEGAKAHAGESQAVRLLVVTGGHSYPVAFYSLFEGDSSIQWTHACSQAEAFRADLARRFDVILLHDMYETIGEKEQANLKAFVEQGGGIVSTHHAIVDYSSWPWWWQEVTGGKFFTQPWNDQPQSQYQDDVLMVVNPVKAAAGHAVLRGVGPLAVVDEAYRGMWISPRVTVLMETASRENDRPVVYLGPNPQFRSVYIQLGHGEETIRNPGYRRLVLNAVRWAGRKAE